MGCNHTFRPFTRRQALSHLGGGFGLVALSSMLNTSLLAAAQSTVKPVATEGAIKALHFKPKAVSFPDGILRVPSRPGLGAVLDKVALRRFAA